MNANAATVRRTCFVYVTIFAWSGLNQPYVPIWLAERGLGDAQVALVVAVPMFTRLLVTPVLGRVADAVPDRRVLVRWMALLGLVLGFALWHANGFWAILFLYALMIVPLQNVAPIFDASALDLVRRGIAKDFGRMRLWGSAGFAVTSLAGGTILAWGGPDAVFLGFLASVAVLGLALLALPPAPAPEIARASAVPEKNLLRRPPVLAMTAAAALVLASHATWNSFGALHLRALGVSDGLIGAMWAVSTLSEIAMFWAGPLLARFVGPFGVLVLAATGGLLRWIVMAGDPGAGAAAAMQVLHAATFSCSHLGLMAFFALCIGTKRSATAQATFATIGSVALGGATLAAGPLYQHFDGGAYWGAALLPTLALTILFVFRRAIADEIAQRRQASP